MLSYKVQLNVKERPASTSLDRLLEELSSVNVANSSGPDDRIAMETTDNELLSTYSVDVEEKPSLNSVQEGRASVPDLNKCFIPSKVQALHVYLDHTWRERMLRLVIHTLFFVSPVSLSKISSVLITYFCCHKLGRCGGPDRTWSFFLPY